MVEPILVGAFLLEAFLDPLAYVAGVLFSIGVCLVFARSVRNMLARSL